MGFVGFKVKLEEEEGKDGFNQRLVEMLGRCAADLAVPLLAETLQKAKSARFFGRGGMDVIYDPACECDRRIRVICKVKYRNSCTGTGTCFCTSTA